MKNSIHHARAFIASVGFVVLSAAMTSTAWAVRIDRDIPYAPDNGKFGLGDLFLPDDVRADTPLVLAIHGGGWGAGDRPSWEGVARFFAERLGFAAFNIEYRLASAATPWPACGDDCVKAALFVLSDEFKKRYSLAHRDIWICGGSAGGHLALWTALKLPPDKVAGAISISGIADIVPDRAAHAGRYRWMAGDGMPEVNPLKIIKPGGPRLLLTHAVGDKVVPVESERNFAAAYRAAGNVAEVFEYPCGIRPGLTGHCIWIPGSRPHRLIPEIESRIVAFARNPKTLVDFTEPGHAYPLWSGAYRRGEAEKQVEVTADGLVVRTDATKEDRPSKWFTIGIPPSVGGRTDWAGRRLALVLSRPPSGRLRSDIALNFSDRDGETFQFVRHAESYNGNGEFCLEFDLTRNIPKKGWGGSRQNGVFDGPLGLSSINLHYNPQDVKPRGEVAFLRIEDRGGQYSKSETNVRNCRSREAISLDTMFPGAPPFPGAEELLFTLEPAFSGTVTLQLSYGSTGHAAQGTMTNFQASATNGVVRFPVRLPYDVQYEFRHLRCSQAAGSTEDPFTVVRGEGVFLQTEAEAMRLRVETGNELHIVRDEKERPALFVANPSEKPVAWRTEFALEDVFGRTVKIPFDRTVPAGGEVRVDVPWPLPAKGLWRVRADVEAGDGSRARKETRFAYIDRHEVTPIVEKPKFRMGIHYHGTRYWPNRVDLTIAAIVAMGAKLTRGDYSFLWFEVEPKPGEYDWEKADVLLRKMREAGLSLDIIFAGSPWWAVEQEYKDKIPEWRKQKLRVRPGMAPTRPGLFRDFAEKFARRYGTQIDYYETGNEWDDSAAATYSHDVLLRMQREAYEGVHAGCPDACVTPNGWAKPITPREANPKEWNMGLVEAFAQHPEWYDAWAVHCHGDFVGFRIRILDGLLPLRESTPLKSRPWLLNETARTSSNGRENDVAIDIWKKILFGWSYGARDYIWYNLRATGWFEGHEPGFGLITADFHPRAGYAAFAALSTIFQGLDADGVVHSSPEAHLFRFKGESKGAKGIVMAGWCGRDSAEQRNVRIRTDASRAELSDYMGNRSPLAVRDGVVAFPVGRLPQALLLHGATKAEAVDPGILERGRADGLLVRRQNANLPNIVLDDVRNVHDNYEAIMEREHRLWKGDHDHSARVWFNRVENGAQVKMLVRDDVSAPGDFAELFVTAQDGACQTVTLKPVRRQGVMDIYEATLPVKGTFGLDMKIHDDDGEGEDSYLFLREPGTSPLQIRFEE